MPNKKLNKFFLSIVLPSVIAISLFILSIYAIFIPAFEKAKLDDKKEMIAELTHTVWSLIDEYEHEATAKQLSLADAQQRALEHIAKVRYGAEQKDYFWIIDNTPTMLMHPYRTDLEGSDLSLYADPQGRKHFVESVMVVQAQSSGFIHYMWQRKDDSTLVAPKLSYVKAFEPWGWIIGTGVYLDDVQAEITQLKQGLLRISLIITIVITLILSFVIRQSLLIEKKRRRLTTELKQSRKKYKTLVEASNQAILMFFEEKIIFSNSNFSQLSGYSTGQIETKSLADILALSWETLKQKLSPPSTNATFETTLISEHAQLKPVIAAISKVQYSGQEGYIISLSEVTRKAELDAENEKFAGDLQNSLLLMKQPIKQAVRETLACDANTTIVSAAKLMARKNEPCLFVRQNNLLLGIVTQNDLLKRVLAEDKNMHLPISQIMTSPIISIDENSPLYEALLRFSEAKVGHLAVTDSSRTITGVISYRDTIELQQNTVSYFVKKIVSANSIQALVNAHKRLPSMVLALIESGDKTSNITDIITTISDAFARRVIELGIESLGQPPCRFVFMVMGSEGRMEQTLSTDQDNAIVFEDVEENRLPEVTQYFLKLGDYLSISLDEIGYNYCKGGIMACNPKWNQPYTTWSNYFNEWMHSSEMEHIVEASIFFDFRGIYGDLSITQNLREYVTKEARNKTTFLQGMAESVSNYKSPLGTFGHFVGNDVTSKENNIDIKMALTPIVKYCRLYSLRYGHSETNTLQRLQKLHESDIISQETYDELSLAYNYLMQMRFRAQAQALLAGNEPLNKVNTTDLTHIESATLKKVFAEIDTVPGIVNRDF